jgi:hypothetical protein
MIKQVSFAVGSALFLALQGAVATLALAQGAEDMYIYPREGQTAHEERRDRFECHEWAVRQTGYDPAQGVRSPTYSTAPPPPGGSSSSGGTILGIGDGGMFGSRSGLLGDAATGAALGAAGGAIAGDAGKGAAIGALASSLLGGLHRTNRNVQGQYDERRYQEEQYYRQQEQARLEQELRRDYRRAYSACLEARGYTVR